MVASSSQASRLLAWMSSLADPTRVRLLRLLDQHELSVVELCDVLQLPQSNVSRHLKMLGDQQWVKSRREGTNRHYQMIRDELDPAARKLWLLAREQTESWSTVKQDQLRLERRLQQREVDSQTFFAGAAAEWDRLRAELYGERFSTAAMLALLPSEFVVADLGCGTGNLSVELAPNVKRVIGVDNSSAMLKAAKKRTANFANVDLRKGDLIELPIETGECDAAMLVLALTYVSDPAAVVREMSRILKPGGKAVIVDLLPHDREEFRRQMGQTSLGVETKNVEAMLSGAGMIGVSSRLLTPEANVKGPALFIVIGSKNF